jgi:hypothetical protein
MGPICCPETSVNNYHTTPRNIPEERRSHKHRGGSLKSKLFVFIVINNCFVIQETQQDVQDKSKKGE